MPGHKLPRAVLASLAATAMLCALVLPVVVHAAPADSWTTVAPMPTARWGLAAATGLDGRIYALGGLTSSTTPLATVEVYTPSTNSWATVAPMPTARGFLAATTGPDGRIYALGGTGSGTAFLTTVEAYTPSTNSWTTVAPMPTGRQLLAAATGLDGRIYALGGYGASTPRLATVEAYTPSTNSWTTVAPMLTGRYVVAAATGLDGRIYALGDNGYGLTTVEAYTPSTNSWATVAPLLTARYGAVATTGLDGRIYSIGGNISGPGASSSVATVEAYTPSTNSWATMTPMPTPRALLAAATGLDGRIYALGGYDNNTYDGVLATVEAYTPASVLTATGTTISPTEGVPFSGTVATFADSDGTTQASAYTATIAWGDGSTTPGTITTSGSGFAVNGSHIYAEEGTAPLTVQITDTDSGVATTNSTAAVADAPLTATGLTAKLKGKRLSGTVASFTDANPGATVADYSATIAWGDGTSSAGTVTATGLTATGSAFTVSGDHTYPKHQSYVLTVTITDHGGSTATVQTTVGKAHD